MAKAIDATTKPDAADVGSRLIPCLERRDQRAAGRGRIAICKLPNSDLRPYWQSAGGAWKVAFIIAPADMLPEDLHREPSKVWGKLQAADDLRLSFLDEAIVVWEDGSQVVEGRVLAADKESVTFKPRATHKLPQQTTAPAKPTHTESKVEMTRVMM
jgi:hypothetical protein